MSREDTAALRIFIPLVIILIAVYKFVMRNTADPQSNLAPRSRDIIYYGVSLISDGYCFFPDWSASIVREFDAVSESKLVGYFEIAKAVSEHPKEEWIARIEECLRDQLE